MCVDGYDHGDINGRLYSLLRQEPYEFSNIVTFIKTVEKILDETEKPRSGMKLRSFRAEDTLAERNNKPEKEDVCNLSSAQMNARGKKATFRLSVMFRQNAGWQGSLQWIDEERQESFRSVLELILMIDSCFPD